MFVVTLTYKCDLEKVEQHLAEHIAFLERQYEQGVFLASGRKVPRTGGVILALADSREQLSAILDEDPFKAHDVADFDIIEFVPTQTSAELSFLRQEVH